MFTKKKPSPHPPADTAKPHPKHKSTIKTHSRGCSLESLSLNPKALILRNFQQSSKQMNQRQLLHNIDSLILSRSSSFAVSTRETILTFCQQETLRNYYIFTKHQQPPKNTPTIELHLVQLIRTTTARHALAPFPHFEPHIYPIMKKHLIKSRRFRKRCNHHPPTHPLQNKPIHQEPPTAFSQDDSAKHYEHLLQPKNTRSESFQLRALTQCIKQMFSKQSLSKNQLGITVNRDNSWLGPNQNDSKKQFIDCDFSSIEAHSKFDLMIESKDKFKEPQVGFQSNYGLQDLKRKYEDLKASKSSENEQETRPFGHKRNPTDVLPDKKSDFYGNPMTPKQQAARSEFGSAENIPLQPMPKKKVQKQKQKEVYEPYMLKFDKKKTEKKEIPPKGPFKQNLKTERRRSKQDQIRSKSRSLKKSGLQPRKKRLQAEL